MNNWFKYFEPVVYAPTHEDFEEWIRQEYITNGGQVIDCSTEVNYETGWLAYRLTVRDDKEFEIPQAFRSLVRIIDKRFTVREDAIHRTSIDGQHFSAPGRKTITQHITLRSYFI